MEILLSYVPSLLAHVRQVPLLSELSWLRSRHHKCTMLYSESLALHVHFMQMVYTVTKYGHQNSIVSTPHMPQTLIDLGGPHNCQLCQVGLQDKRDECISAGLRMM